MPRHPPIEPAPPTRWAKRREMISRGHKDLAYLPRGRSEWNMTLAALAYGIVIYFSHEAPKAIAAAVAMVIAVTLANLLGAMLPFFFKRAGVDPAVTSGPFIACLMDVGSILIFFSTAVLVLEKLN